MVVCLCRLFIYEVSVVSTYKFYAVLIGQLYDDFVCLLLQGEGLTVGTNIRVFHLVALQLQVVVITEESVIPFYCLPCSSNVSVENLRRHLTGNTCRTYDESFVIFLQFFMVCTRSVVKALNPRIRHQFYEVLVTLKVLCQHNEVISSKVFLCLLQMHVAASCYIHLTSEYWLERFLTFGFSSFVHAIAIVEQFFYTEHVSVVSDSHTSHTVSNSLVNQFLHWRLSVKY